MPKKLSLTKATTKPKNPGTLGLLADVLGLILAARDQVAGAVDSGLVTLYWHIGRRIHQDILKERRAEYGAKIVAALGRQLGGRISNPSSTSTTNSSATSTRRCAALRIGTLALCSRRLAGYRVAGVGEERHPRRDVLDEAAAEAGAGAQTARGRPSRAGKIGWEDRGHGQNPVEETAIKTSAYFLIKTEDLHWRPSKL